MTFLEHPNQLSYKNGVPFVIWCYWEGATMTGNRLLSFNYMLQHIGVPICLVTPQNLHLFLIEDHQLPSSYDDLSIVHRSDYIRAYLLNYYGGGWHDIKATEVSYANAWEEFSNPNIWMIGRPEIQKGAAKVYDVKNRYIPDYYQELIAVPSWIGRPHTALSKAILTGIENTIDKNKDLLKIYPSKHPRDKKITDKYLIRRFIQKLKFTYQGRSTNYPLNWTLFGNVFHPCVLLYSSHISKNLPVDIKKNAGIYHR